MTDVDFLRRAIAQGQGRGEADLVLKGCRFLDLVTGDLVPSDIAICGDRIVGTFGTYRGRCEIDLTGKVVVPGFIDTHFHVESSLMPPQEFERCVLPHGVTTGICDPHEMANVLGTEAFAWFLASSRTLAMDLRVQLSSCVPATDHLETSGARITAADLMPFAQDPKVIGLAEFMNFPGVLAADPAVLAKLAAFQGRHIDGHAPLLRGEALNGYIAAGIRTEHEATTPAEALEKLSKGMTVLIREGSVCKDLHALAPILTERTAPFLAFCTDDRNPLDIAEEGHLDYVIRTAIALGAPPLAAYRAASWSAARAFGLHDRGLVAPGQRADLVVLDDLAACAVSRVISAGRPVDETLFAARTPVAPIGRGSVRARRVAAADFAALGSGPSTPVIGVVPGKIITLRCDLTLPYSHGERRIDLGQDVIKVAVVERHGRTAPGERGIGVAFVKGFGLQRGAIASSVGHDSHNITVVGADEVDMAVAVNRLGQIEGGFVVVADGQVLAEIALPLAGLMSLMPFDVIRRDLVTLRAAARGLGVVLPEPFLQVAFLPLPVIPHLKITDRGLVDVDRFTLIDP
ncbi:adenine deaminase [Methylobacterium sp. A49B]|uniref:Adenine deaminase n=1 Tax=Methylobacterium mesophilicum SR1.6/6 TaxID=908290 RepID=A0A6B9FP70_9HYPH|nr:adenine deaminase [Methylobacterium mesophilicum]QGY02778.1 adenine deaminase [Methylobacterium mesophilicum SR1.6/6]